MKLLNVGLPYRIAAALLMTALGFSAPAKSEAAAQKPKKAASQVLKKSGSTKKKLVTKKPSEKRSRYQAKKRTAKKSYRLTFSARTRSKNQGWRRPLLDHRMVANKRLGVGQFNQILDPSLCLKKAITHSSSSPRSFHSRTNSRISSKGSRLTTNSSLATGSGRFPKNSHLARITVYWAKGRGTDHYTRHLQSATGVRLMRGHCAVDPQVIPYGSVVRVHGVGDFWAVDTGSAVRARRAAQRLGRTKEEREAIVVDLFFPTRAEALAMSRRIPRFTMVSWKVLPRL